MSASLTQVVLDVARDEALAVPVRRPTKLVEDLGHGLPHDVAQNVEAAAVGHPQDHHLGAQVGDVVDHGLEPRNERLRSLWSAFGGVLKGREGQLKRWQVTVREKAPDGRIWGACFAACNVDDM